MEKKGLVESTQELAQPAEDEREASRRAEQERIRSLLFSYSREPFLEVLAEGLGCKPDPESLHRFANRFPDRWAQYIAIMARLFGFTEKLEIANSLTINIQQMSDSQLLEKAQQLGLSQEVVEGSFTEIEATEVEPGDEPTSG